MKEYECGWEPGTPLSRGFSCEVCDRGYAHNEVSHDGGETWTKVCDVCHAKEMGR